MECNEQNLAEKVLEHIKKEEPQTPYQMWEALFPGNEEEFIPWDDLVAKTVANDEHEGLVYSDNNKVYFNLEKRELDILSNFLKNRNNLSKSGFLRFFGFFNPIKRTHSGCPTDAWTLEDVMQVLQHESFHGFEDATMLSRKLSDKEEGTFITRFSPTRIGGYAIQVKANSVLSLKIETHGVHHLNMPCSSVSAYPNLKQLVDGKRN